MTEHLINFHKGECAQDFVKITILEEVKDIALLKKAESKWAHKLFTFYPSGLNIREEAA